MRGLFFRRILCTCRSDGKYEGRNFQNWYTNYLHSFVGDPYEEKPSVNAPYATGSLKQEFLEEGLKAANFSRYLVGLPDDLELDPILVNRPQHGAVVLAANKWITHSPSKPEVC